MEAQTKPFLFLFFYLFFLLTDLAHAEVHYHEFIVETKTVKRLCKKSTIVTVNGQFPGPTLEARNGDILVIQVVNHVKHNVSIHWHGVKQMRNGWADGTAYVTQCPIKPGASYMYRITIEEQEGTLWWHAHTSWLRTTVYGALIIRPKKHLSYPFPKPQREFPIILGEWWTESYIEMAQQALELGIPPKISNAIIVNGQPGDFYNCSKRETTVFSVLTGETVLLRFINAGMFTELFVSIASHTMTVVGVDASYTKPFITSVVVIGPGQTTDVLVHANQPPGRYYMAAHLYASGLPIVIYDKTMTTAIFDYGRHPNMSPTLTSLPNLPVIDDKATVAAFTAGIKSQGPVQIPDPVDEHLFITFGLGFFYCSPNTLCGGPNMTRVAGSMNNISFVLPTDQSLLQAAHSGLPGVFTTDFPAYPLVQFDYTGDNISQIHWNPVRGTKLYKIKYGSVVQVVFQATRIITAEQHLIHIHGYDFYVLAMGTGNFEPKSDEVKFNLVDPPKRNTVAVPARGWAVIRFVADNPGVWSVHCHMDLHLEWGMAMAFLVENGDGEIESTLPPPPDLPRC